MNSNHKQIKIIKENIYTKPNKNSFNAFYNNNINYNNMLIDLLDNNSIDDDKNVMISKLDIDISNSQNENIEEKEQNNKKVIATKENQPKQEF